ncbi:MAG: penicillin-binding protein activator [Bdellovibrionota bacterium]
MKWLIVIFTSLFIFSCSTLSDRPELKRGRQTTRRQVPPRKPVEGGVITSSQIPVKIESILTSDNQTKPVSPDIAATEFARVDAIKRDYLLNPNAQEPLKTRIIGLNDEELEQVIRDGEFGLLRVHALFERSRRLQEKGNFDGAIVTLEDVRRLAPGSDLSDKAEVQIRELRGVNTVNKDTIAALLPLSGKNALQGQRALRSLQMGLGIVEGDTTFKLKVLDSEGSANGAETALHKLVFEEHPIAVVGPILSRAAVPVAEECEKFKIPCINLAQKAQVTQKREYVFSHSLGSSQLAKFIAEQAFQKGLRNFAILYPNDPYGIEYANAFWDEVLERGGHVTAVQSYDANDKDFKYVAQRLVSSFYLEARKEEFNLRTKNTKKDVKIRQNTSIDETLPPLIDFDAIFIPDSSRTMGQLGAFLSYVGVKKITLLGTNLWNTPGLSKRASQFKDTLYFADMYNPADETHKALPFFKAYFEKYGEYPGPLEVNAYEVGLILRQGLLRKINSRPSMQSYLANVKEFPGVFGPLNMTPQRLMDRPLTLFRVEKDEIVIAQ